MTNVGRSSCEWDGSNQILSIENLILEDFLGKKNIIVFLMAQRPNEKGKKAKKKAQMPIHTKSKYINKNVMAKILNWEASRSYLQNNKIRLPYKVNWLSLFHLQNSGKLSIHPRKLIKNVKWLGWIDEFSRLRGCSKWW